MRLPEGDLAVDVAADSTAEAASMVLAPLGVEALTVAAKG